MARPAVWEAQVKRLLLLLLVAGCKIDAPTEYTVSTPDCPWPPPLVTDTTVSALPLGCPYRLPNGQTVDGWPL
jgi:hypothetical protein